MKVLVVVDMQHDFIAGALGSPEAQAIVPAVVEKVKTFDREIWVTYDTHGGDYLDTQEGQQLPVPHCIAHTEGWQLEPRVREALSHKDCATVHSVEKPTFGSLELANTLSQRKDIEEITLIGLCTDICVIANAMLLKAALPEVPIYIDANCCAGVTPERHQNALDAMACCQIFSYPSGSTEPT